MFKVKACYEPLNYARLSSQMTVETTKPLTNLYFLLSILMLLSLTLKKLRVVVNRSNDVLSPISFFFFQH